MSALNTAVFWVEYVIRHGFDSKSLKAHSLSWYQYFLLDVLIFIVTGFVSIIFVMYKSIKILNSLIYYVMI